MRLKGRVLKAWHAHTSRAAAILARATALRNGQGELACFLVFDVLHHQCPPACLATKEACFHVQQCRLLHIGPADPASVAVPRPLSGGGPAAANSITAVSDVVHPIIAEMQHLRRFCRLYVPPDEGDADSRLPCDEATWMAFQQTGDEGGRQLLLGQWQHKDQVGCMLCQDW